MMNDEQQQALALAATIQSLGLVNEVATKGHFDKETALPVLNALINYNPEDCLVAFGDNIASLRTGIGQTKVLLSDQINRDIAQYLLAVFAIELKLVRNNSMRQQLREALQQAANTIRNSKQIEDDDGINESLNDRLVSDAIIADFASLYKQTASQTEPRIMIKGNHQYLQDETSANQIRALLLAALRSAAFFRHYGGRRIDLMVKRGHYLETLNNW